MSYQTSQAYDNARPMYSAAAAAAAAPSTFSGPYGAQPNMARYGALQSSPNAVKNELGPPARPGGSVEADHAAESKAAHAGYAPQPDADGEHEGEYTHASASYGAAKRPSYGYQPNPAPGPIHPDPSHISPEMTHSPHANGSGRATPRTTNTYASYATPQRPSQLPSGNLNYVMGSDARAGAQPNGADPYPTPGTAYAAQPPYSAINGAPPSNKRGRDEDDPVDRYGRPISAGGDPTLKRQRTDPNAIRPISQPQSVKAGGVRR